MAAVTGKRINTCMKMAMMVIGAAGAYLGLRRGSFGLIYPFGNLELGVVQAVACVPLAAALSGRAELRPGRRVAIGLALAVLSILVFLLWRGLEATLVPRAGAVSGIARVLVRAVLGVLVSLPGMILFAPWRRAGAGVPIIALLGLATAIAILPPLAFAHSLENRLATEASEAVSRRRVAGALATVDTLSAMGETRSVAGLEIKAMRRNLEKEVQELERFLTESTDRSEPSIRLRRGESLARLDRHVEAIRELEPLGEESIDARLLLAAVRQGQGLFSQSTSDYEAVRDRALALLSQSARRDELEPGRAFEACRRAYDGIAFNATKLGRPGDAEAAYRRELGELPGLTPYITYRLGLLAADRGDATTAIEYISQALPFLPSDIHGSARLQIRQLLQESPGCTVGLRSSPGLGADRSPAHASASHR